MIEEASIKPEFYPAKVSFLGARKPSAFYAPSALITLPSLTLCLRASAVKTIDYQSDKRLAVQSFAVEAGPVSFVWVGRSCPRVLNLCEYFIVESYKYDVVMLLRGMLFCVGAWFEEPLSKQAFHPIKEL